MTVPDIVKGALFSKRVRDRVSFSVGGFPPIPSNWSLGPLYTQEGVAQNPALAGSIASVMEWMGTDVAYAPSVAAMSGLIVEPHELSTELLLPGGKKLRRKKELPSDGTWLSPGESFVMSGGGCPILVATSEGKCLVAHCSRDSLLDRAKILTGKSSRRYHSVVDAVVNAFRKRDIPPENVKISIYFAVDPNDFEHDVHHPVHGLYNMRMCGHVMDFWHDAVEILPTDVVLLDCALLAELQALGLGMELAETQGDDSEDQIEYESRYLRDKIFGHTRHRVEEMRTQRNFVIVHRTK